MTDDGRKIIQIQTLVVPGMDNMSHPSVSLIALCDDGTLWLGDTAGSWEQLHGPEHLPVLESAYRVRTNLQEALDEETYERVRKALAAGGTRL